MKVKIVKAGSSNYWYSTKIGQEFVVMSHNSTDYKVNATVAGQERFNGNYIDIKDCELVKDEPRLFDHEGKQYILPDWAKFVTCDGVDNYIFGWEFEPKAYHYEGPYEHAGFGRSGGKREILVRYVKPLPTGAFIVDVSNIKGI